MLKFIANATASAGLKPMLNGIPEVRKIGEIKDIRLKNGKTDALSCSKARPCQSP